AARCTGPGGAEGSDRVEDRGALRLVLFVGDEAPRVERLQLLEAGLDRLGAGRSRGRCLARGLDLRGGDGRLATRGRGRSRGGGLALSRGRPALTELRSGGFERDDPRPRNAERD